MLRQKLKLPFELELYRQKIEATLKPYIKIKERANNKLDLWQSKFGGLLYLPKGVDYPKNAKGEYLYLLAQINFSEVPNLKNFPKTGILQFYILPNEFYGKYLQSPVDQEDFRILYIPEITYDSKKIITDFDFLPKLQLDTNIFPIKNSCSLEFSCEIAPMSFSDGNFTSQIGYELYDILCSNHQLWDEYTQIADCGSNIGGYPTFVVEGDERFYHLPDEDYRHFILLLQIDSNNSENICWKNSDGVGNFFIEQSALKKLDFSEVFYAWDCSD
ncbi:YwqG family protein [Crocosphaera sp.]|uniref:YwqG family protein n=1 Tax=Crocosphaera sp. TaxID=2729996 RepID=UPI0026305610|nr:YwqG family protein [Crocosphaera sp.]MDJ0579491.1 YwqG family protein [Crocosphaera sp.]